MARNVFVGASFMAAFEARHAVDSGLDTQLLWGSDYPHIESTWQFPDDEGDPPSPTSRCATPFGGIPHERDPQHDRRERGPRRYGLDEAALRDVARRIGAPTLQELAQPVSQVPAGASPQAFRTSGPWN